MERAEGFRVLGIDPGSRVAGYGVLDAPPGAPPKLVACGGIRLGAGELPARLKVLHEAVSRLLEEHRPAVLAVETVFHGKSFASVLKVGEARGVVLLAGALAGVQIQQFTPAMVKKAATGNGRAPKSQVQRMIARTLGLGDLPEPADAADALAIAFCYSRRAWKIRLGCAPARAGLTLSRGPGGR